MNRIAHLAAGSLTSLFTLGAVAAGGLDGTLRFGDHTIDGKGVVTTKILWTSNSFLAGFQFDVVGAEVISAEGGITEQQDWLVEHSPSRVLAVDISGTSIGSLLRWLPEAKRGAGDLRRGADRLRRH